LSKRGYDVAVSAFFGLHGAALEWEGLQVFPGGNDGYGNDIIAGHAKRHFGDEEGVVVTLVDAWVLNTSVLNEFCHCMWAPIDHDPIPPGVLESLRSSEGTPIAMSKHGENAMKEAGLDPIYVPHGVDTRLFVPMDEEGRMEARRMLNWPEDAFVVGMVAANRGVPSRKGFPQAIEAFARFSKSQPNALLYLHTEPHGLVHGVNIPRLLELNGVSPDSVRFFDPYYYTVGADPQHLVTAYNAMDVLLNPSTGEGFGIPIIEAQACGTPVIVTNWTSMPELAGAGWLVGGQMFYTDQCSYQMTPSVDEIVAALFDASDRAHKQRGRAREFALGYDANLVADLFWVPALEKVAEKYSGIVEVISS
jgi:glycosyltransferase involved in cell wall biosynthesis